VNIFIHYISAPKNDLKQTTTNLKCLKCEYFYSFYFCCKKLCKKTDDNHFVRLQFWNLKLRLFNFKIFCVRYKLGSLDLPQSSLDLSGFVSTCLDLSRFILIKSRYVSIKSQFVSICLDWVSICLDQVSIETFDLYSLKIFVSTVKISRSTHW
jgi:hypothetical protein